ncbi:TrkH family potassium uptake protein [Desulfosporosinus youngiae]|uniref:Potassium uptake protein, TrkH family n=1 Tax=Desulfosporosinus youngiae DSM 17734 TaxID=768710 RepID=H5XSW4_9FIRM|nr:TrkH family potassium uptake protein [Desulfosporosinus youngiae]EHQ87927.1 potassium uptake protein, TrkH family [Desulfosporosinus youngiae DSM 17734]
MNRFGRLMTPSRILVMGFILFAILGSTLLTLSISTKDGGGLPLLDAVFTATSALSVTGLVVVDTAATFTIFGQLVILFLIQVGGIGFMTFAAMFAIMLGRRITLRERLLLKEALNQVSTEGVVRLAKSVISFSFIIEAVGCLILTLRWAGDLGWGNALYYGVFHAVSAFNNAGFAIFGQSSNLMSQVEDPVTNSVIMLMIILGGLGFTVLANLYTYPKKKLTLHSKTVMKVSGFLIVIGAGVIFLLEMTNPLTLGGLPAGTKVMAAFFQSVTRTCGFNTVDIASMRDTTLLTMMVLMFIGASPASTGGGIKTTTFLAIVLSVLNTFQSHPHVVLGERTLPKADIQKAWAITALAIFMTFSMTSILTITESADVFVLLFEVISALATVGLSLGITPELSAAGKVVIIVSMFMGRVGLLTLGFFLSQRAEKSAADFKYPEERILIG